MSDPLDLTPQILSDIRDELRGLNGRVDHLTTRVDDGFARVDKQLDRVDKRLERVDKRLERLEGQMGTVVGILNEDVATEIATLKRRVDALETRDSTDA